MVSAGERAEVIALTFGDDLSLAAVVKMEREIERHLREHARDQRCLCAEEMNGLRSRADADLGTLHLAYSAAMDAPEPGKDR